jgi:hypothetical protein
MLAPTMLIELGKLRYEEAENVQAIMLCEARLRHIKRQKQGLCAHCNKPAVSHFRGDNYCRSHFPTTKN